jgi:hypothetical protein
MAVAAASARMSRRQILVTVAVSAAVWLLFSSTWPMLPVRLLVTLVHEAGHAVTIQLLGGDVSFVIVNEHGGGLTSGRLRTPDSATARVLVSSAGYLGTAVVGALLLEGATRLRRGRVAAIVLAVLVAAIGFAWVPWRVEPDAFSAAATGSSSGDGRFTVLVCAVAVLLLVGLAAQPMVRLRTGMIAALATTFCLASVDDLRRVLDLSARGGHSDAANAASATSLSSWMWAAIWLVLGGAACAVGVWAALSKDDQQESPATPLEVG